MTSNTIWRIGVALLASGLAGLAAAAAPQAGDYTPGAPFQDCQDCPEMVTIPAGNFLMGSSDAQSKSAGVSEDLAARERPQHKVTFARPFAMSRFEVTRKEWAAFVKDAHYTLERPCRALKTPETQNPADPWKNQIEYRNDLTWDHPGFAQTDRHPAVCLSWDDAQAYVKWLSDKTGKHYRLPSEAEWEYAARAGSANAFPFAYDPKTICRFANTGDKSFIDHNPIVTGFNKECDDTYIWTAPVGSFPPNAFGLYDMVGNGWEWAQDCLHDNYDGAPIDGSVWQGPADCEYVARGGGWFNAPSSSRPAFRVPDPAAYRGAGDALRIVRDVP